MPAPNSRHRSTKMENELNNKDDMNKDNLNNENSEEKLVFEIETDITEKMYIDVTKKLNHIFDKKQWISFALLIAGGVIMLVASRYNKIYFALGILYIMASTLFMSCRFIAFPKRIKQAYKILENNNECKNVYEFYETYMKRINSTGVGIFKYDQFDFCVDADECLTVYVPINKIIIIEKDKCSEENLQFIKSCITAEASEKHKKNTKKYNVTWVTWNVLVIAIAIFILLKSKPVSDYQFTPYSSFEAYTEFGAVTDVVITNRKVATYTYTGSGEEEHFYVNFKDEEELIELLERYDVPWSKQ